MAYCRGCGSESLRTLASYGENQTLLREVCKECSPDSFDEYRDPSDNKIYTGPEALPHMYKTRLDGTLVAKDELMQDTWDILKRDSEDEGLAERIRKKRETSRREPLSLTEVEQAKQWGDKVLRPVLEGQI